MQRIITIAFVVVAGLGMFSALGKMGFAHGSEVIPMTPSGAAPLPIILEHKGDSPDLERPAVTFDHDRHTKALQQEKSEDCAVCHVLKETDKRLINPDVAVFTFPKTRPDEADKTAIMYAYHQACASCHRKLATEGKKTGPAVGLCGKCHVRKNEFKKVVWGWSPIFNYARHARHLQAAEKFDPTDKLTVAKKLEVLDEITPANKNCLLCHHTYDKSKKKLIYKKNTENSCRACHKAQDEKNARSMKKVSHAACIGCHMKLAEKVKAELVQQGRSALTEQDKKRFGPFECKGCHGEHKELTPDEIAKIPRLVRGQKDVIDLPAQPVSETSPQRAAAALALETKTAGMKVVAFNHKAHEPRGQFCSTCHHHSLEKCGACHTVQGDREKGGGITYQQAFHVGDAKRSCAGCHMTVKQNQKCLGCHRRVTAQLPQSACGGCHVGPSSGVAREAAALPLAHDKEKVPEKVQMKDLEKDYKPAEIPHMKVVNRLITISNESSLARWFHSKTPDALCLGCHHKSQPLAQMDKKAPKCASCHGRFLNPSDLAKPGLQTAYHQQCTGCHQAMGQKPTPLECDKCHPAKTPLRLIDKIEIPLQGYAK